MASQTPDPSVDGESVGRSEITLADGTHLALEVREAAEAQKLSQDGLKAAATVIAEAAARRRQPTDEPPAFGGIVGKSPPMQELFRLLERIQGSHATILVTGENGTGKELVARAIHEHSSRGDRRFVATNCSAFNDNLLESELFGHKKGSFTGAVSDKPGLFEVADGGTFFLDEVGDMSPALQVKLLRVLQEGVFMPVGATEQRAVDVRIIAATNRDLSAMVKKGEFREDLYYRLHVVALRVPPLRERKQDIPLLVEHFLERLAKRDGTEKILSQRAMQKLMDHDWPGNVRELENEIERLWVLSGSEGVIDEEHLTPAIRNGTRRITVAPPPPDAAGGDEISVPSHSTLPAAVEQLERQMILDGLRRAKGNKTRAAEDLGISRRNLIRKVQAFDLENAWQQPKGSAGKST